MTEDPMDNRQHPRHKVIWLGVVAFFVALALVTLAFALYIDKQGGGRQALFDVLALSFMGLLAIAGILGAVGARFSRCPECGRWIGRSRSIDDERIRFVCRSCRIVFDSGV